MKSWAKIAVDAAVHPPEPGDDAVAGVCPLLHAEVAAAVDLERIHLLEGAGIDEQLDAFVRRELAAVVLLLDGLGAAAEPGRFALLAQLADAGIFAVAHA